MDLSAILNPLNDAQRAAVTAPVGPVLVLAGAGSGKTRVLTHRIAYLIQALGSAPQSILAVTFTNKAAGEMRGRVERLLGMPGSSLWIGTFHGIAHRLLRIHWREAGLVQGFQILDSEDQQRLIKKVIRAAELDETRWVPREVQGFINSNKDEGRRPRQLKDPGDPTRGQLIRLYAAYEEACAKAGVVDFAELLLRAFELWRDNPSLLEHYRRRFRHVLVDEFQDTNAIQYAWMRLLAAPESRAAGAAAAPQGAAQDAPSAGHPFVVGDDDQCLAAGTLVAMADGSKRPIEAVSAGDLVMSCYGSGALRPAKVSERLVRKRSGRMLRLHMRSGRVLCSTPEHTHFAGYILGETPQTYFLYLMHKEGRGWRLGTSQVYTRGQERPKVGFEQRSAQEHADGTWIIRTHETENEARLDEMVTSLRYGLPTLPFVPRKGASVNGLVHDPAHIARIFESLDTDSAALRLLEEVGLDPEQPHYRPRGRNSNRHNIVITLCADRRGLSPMHRISVAGVRATARGTLEALGFSVRAAKHNHKSWRFETVRKDLGELMTMARRIRERLDAQCVFQGLMQKRSLPFVSASAIRPGMVVAADDDGFDIVERIEVQQYEGEVYDLNIERTHNFIANGIITHNSIYGWRGARAENLNQFRRDFSQAQLFRLEQNYRSTGTILEAANGVIAHNAGRIGKKLWTSGARGEPIKLYTAYNERDEAEFVTHRIREYVSRGGSRREIAILYRSNAQSRAFEEAFLSSRIPYRVYGGLRFFERAEIKDALAYLRLIANRRDDASFERVVNLPTRGVGAKSLDVLREHARSAGASLWEAAAACAGGALGTKAAGAIRGFMALIERLAAETRSLALHELVDQVLKASGLVEHYRREKADRGEARAENLDELVTAARGFTPEASELPPLESFLAHAALEAGEGQADEWEDCVQMMTLHSAKGLEFPVVFLAGMEEGLFPHQRSLMDLEGLEEERRLCYVGMTRAMRQLYLTCAEQRRLHGIDSYGQISRFVREIPENLVEEVRPRVQVSRPLAVGRFRSEEGQAGGVRLGARVRHGKFGEGVVLNVEGAGAQARVQVSFERQGTKWLMVQYANLEPL
ncbi:MAG TPA: 3'-5' exonuclease [Steroidobacteraceae bacterium]|nr:3'-5' exonuclease [Steroidobacteraceae bacterium]